MAGPPQSEREGSQRTRMVPFVDLTVERLHVIFNDLGASSSNKYEETRHTEPKYSDASINFRRLTPEGLRHNPYNKPEKEYFLMVHDPRDGMDLEDIGLHKQIPLAATVAIEVEGEDSLTIVFPPVKGTYHDSIVWISVDRVISFNRAYRENTPPHILQASLLADSRVKKEDGLS